MDFLLDSSNTFLLAEELTRAVRRCRRVWRQYFKKGDKVCCFRENLYRNVNFLTMRAIITTQTSLWLCSYCLWESTYNFKACLENYQFIINSSEKDFRRHTSLEGVF